MALRKRGADWWGLCPFHADAGASFHITPSKQLYKCFGCGAGGDVFTFLQAIEGLTFPQALARAAEIAGMDVAPDASFTSTPALSRRQQAVERMEAELAEHFRQVEGISRTCPEVAARRYREFVADPVNRVRLEADLKWWKAMVMAAPEGLRIVPRSAVVSGFFPGFDEPEISPTGKVFFGTWDPRAEWERQSAGV